MINQNEAQQLATCPSPSLLKDRVDLQTEFDLITATEADRLLLRSRSTYYEHGDKAIRLLAHQLHRQAASLMILQIKDPSGTLHTDPNTINSVFCSPDASEMGAFLDSLDFPTVSPHVTKDLDLPLTVDEINTAINNMQNNKAPGPDGFPVAFFKRLQSKLAPILLSVYKESLQVGSLPPTLRQASISLLLKKDKDPNVCGSYRPLSLLNVDAKILAKALASRLERFLPAMISEE